MPPTFRQTISRNVSDYTAVAREVERFCTENCLPLATSFKVRLVLEELVLNLIDHAVSSGTDRIDVAIDLEPGRVVLVLEDDSARFDPHSAPAFDKAKPLEERGPRGMGLHVVRSVAENVAYQRVGTCNRVQVVITK
jgi:anti-sigma regulatory factor (Ser/Thr protein kinase)